MQSKQMMIAVPNKGGNFTAHKEGKVLFEIGLAAGIHKLTKYLEYLPIDADFDLSEDVQCISCASSGVTIVARDRKHETGANPKYKPSTNAEERFQRMGEQIHRLSERVTTAERQEKAVKRRLARQAERDAEIEANAAEEAEAKAAKEAALIEAQKAPEKPAKPVPTE